MSTSETKKSKKNLQDLKPGMYWQRYLQHVAGCR